MFEELNDAFPDHTHFYEVRGLTLTDALDKCARMTGDSGNVFNHQGKIIFAVKHSLGTDLPWANLVPGSPLDVKVISEDTSENK